MHYELIFDAAINQEKVGTFIGWTNARMIEGMSELTIAMSTTGGNVAQGLTMMNFMKSLGIPITIHNIGTIDSVGIAIYATASTRLSNNNASFTFHGAGITTSERLDEERLQHFLDLISTQNALISKAIQEACGLSPEKSRELLVGEQTKSVAWAIENGLCHAARDFSLTRTEKTFHLT
ncbi:ATP-dependent Clp protease proteolytic subunit [Salipiger sp. PrR003]|uniref:ATP-dependent Clp protease proteolytic subunit n=1 Tax=Salipiger sp. PrR003 TaxID=2706776 RepID=UPI0013D90ED0|nr:ATP-dependent Clp protease proteolytic subunit [Salipiger sp. PrR003]NDV53898.1 hypothetical protein [Salipiger sp. PrR003]